MSSSDHVDVHTEVLEELRDGLSHAQSNVQVASRTAELDIRDVLNLLQQHIDHWEKVKKRCLERLHYAEDAAARRAAQQCIDDAERKLKILRNHVNNVNHDASRFRKSMQVFVHVLDEPIVVLSRLLAVLFRYLQMSSTNANRSTSTINGERIDYGKLDENSRATGIHAIVSEDMIGTGTKANPSIIPPGYQKGASNLARGHLLARQLGGSGDDPRNLVTLYQNPVNTPVMRDVEVQVRKVIEAGETVKYSAVPTYQGDEGMPSGITITAVGNKGFFLHRFIPNKG